MSNRGDVVQLLPGLRRFAVALTGAQETPGPRQADEMVLRAVHTTLRAGPYTSQVALRTALYGAFIHLQHGRPPAQSEGLTPIAGGLRELPLAHRAALLLVTLESFSYDEAADILGVSRNILLGRLAATRQMLARHMEAASSGAARPPHLRLVK